MRTRPASGHQRVSSDQRGPSEQCSVTGANGERVSGARTALLDDDAYVEIAETFRALADSTRVKIIYSLLYQDLCTCDLAAIVGTSESAVSQHIRVLRSLRLIRSRRDGKMVFHSLDDTHINILLSVCLSHVRDVERHNEGLEHMLDFFGGHVLAPA